MVNEFFTCWKDPDPQEKELLRYEYSWIAMALQKYMTRTQNAPNNNFTSFQSDCFVSISLSKVLCHSVLIYSINKPKSNVMQNKYLS